MPHRRRCALIGAGRGGIDLSAAPKGTPVAPSGDAVVVIGPKTPCKTADPLLLLDIDGVLSLFGFTSDERPPGSWIQVDGSPHFISADAPAHLLALGDFFEIVWCSGWEERANEHLPALLGLPGPLPYLSFDQNPGRERATGSSPQSTPTQGKGRWHGSTTRSTRRAFPGPKSVARRRCWSAPTRRSG